MSSEKPILRLWIMFGMVMGSTLLGSPAQAQAVAFKTGEITTGMTKQCFYSGVGGQYTRTVSAVALCPLSIQVQAVPTYNAPVPQSRMGGAVAFKIGEQTTGMTKQCFYSYLGSQISRTVSAVALCPLSVRVGN